MTKADKIEAFLHSAVGCGYVYGATGWVCSPARRAQQAAQYPQYEQTIMNTCAKWDGKVCYDCAQLVKAGAKLAGFSLPSGATSQWKWTGWAGKGTYNMAPDGVLLCVFRDDGTGTKQHVGWRLRGGDVIDARGSSAGVVLNQKYSGWTHWAELPGMDEEETEMKLLYQAEVATESGALNVREGRSSGTRKVGSLPKGTIVDVIDDSNSEWIEIRYVSKETNTDIEGFVAKKYLKVPGDTAPVIEAKPEETKVEAETTTMVRSDGCRITLSGQWHIANN